MCLLCSLYLMYSTLLFDTIHLKWSTIHLPMPSKCTMYSMNWTNCATCVCVQFTHPVHCVVCVWLMHRFVCQMHRLQHTSTKLLIHACVHCINECIGNSCAANATSKSCATNAICISRTINATCTSCTTNATCTSCTTNATCTSCTTNATCTSCTTNATFYIIQQNSVACKSFATDAI